jgi:hypothetical protein
MLIWQARLQQTMDVFAQLIIAGASEGITRFLNTFTDILGSHSDISG